jgi:cyclopropane-fatty-acyl-phospholipid synthase
MLRALRKHLSLDAVAARSLVERVFETHPPRNFSVRLWDGHEIASRSDPDFTLVFLDAEALRRCMISRDLGEFAEAYVEGRLLIEGDLWEAVGISTYLRELEITTADVLRFGPRLVVPSSSHTVEHDRRDVRAHYDLCDDLFKLFLDERLVYSCAYFSDPADSLERAQERKLDLICRKLDLRPGELLLDVGCGWGALLIWAAERYGVHAHGITLSENQAAEGRRRVAAAGVGDRVTIEVCDYRDLPADRFDKISSVGMVEHVGAAKLGVYLETIHRALRPGGLFLNHGITARVGASTNTGSAFVFRHVFPGAELVPVTRIGAQMEALGFEILDVEALRRHYALTLRHWFQRYLARRAEAAQVVSDRTLRIWDLYLAGCARAFEDGIVGVHQVLVAKPDIDGSIRAPLTRAQMLPT